MRPVTLVVVGDPKAPQMRLLKQLPAQVEVIVSDDADELRTAVPKADILVNGGFHGTLFRQVFPYAAKAQWVHSLSTGVENMLSPELVASPIPLTNGRGVFNSVLAEFVMAAVLYFAKDFRRMIRSQSEGKWSPFDVLAARGTTLAIIGYGNLGKEAAKLAHTFGMKVVALRRRASESVHDPHLAGLYARDRLHEMLAVCDYLVIAAPDTPETKGMIGEPELNVMKREAVVINIGRGPIIVESALVRALETNRIKGAALDVFDQEPLPAGHPFYRLENVLLSPHCADHLPGWVDMAMDRFLENFRRFSNDEPLENLVDKKAGY
jgi:phosphoglycerate dehydrogenase-like enzyme